MSGLILNFVQLLVLILQIAIIGRAVLSWFPINPQSPLIAVLNEITEPILAPLRRVVPRIGMIDITPMVAIFVLYIIQRVMAGGL
ncbi:MAG: YggT family protein [Dehalococcoidia bacterium]